MEKGGGLWVGGTEWVMGGKRERIKGGKKGRVKGGEKGGLWVGKGDE